MLDAVCCLPCRILSYVFCGVPPRQCPSVILSIFRTLVPVTTIPDSSDWLLSSWKENWVLLLGSVRLSCKVGSLGAQRVGTSQFSYKTDSKLKWSISSICLILEFFISSHQTVVYVSSSRVNEMSTDTKYVPIVSVYLWKYDFWHDFYLDIHQQIWLWTILVFFINGEIMSCQLKSNVLKSKQLMKPGYWYHFGFWEQEECIHHFLQNKEFLSHVPFPPEMMDSIHLLYWRQNMIIILCFISLTKWIGNPSSWCCFMITVSRP